MYRTVNRLLLVLIPGLAIVLAMPIKARAAVTFNQQIPFTVVLVNPCPPGNPLTQTGNFHIVGIFSIDASGGVHGNVSSNLDSFLSVDQVTGTLYRGHSNGQTTDGFPPDSFKFNINDGETLEYSQDLHGGLEAQGGSVPNLNFRLKLHVTILPDGTITSDVSSFTVTCQ